MKKHRPKPASRRKPVRQPQAPTPSRDRHRLTVDPAFVHEASYRVTDKRPELEIRYDVAETALTRDYVIPKA